MTPTTSEYQAAHATDTTPLYGRHAVVTGGGRGIGAAAAGELARMGANVTIMGRDRARLDATADALRQAQGVEVVPCVCDVADERSVAHAFEEARGRLGDVYALVNNAGVAEGALIGATTRESWDRTIGINLTGTFLCTQQVVQQMTDARAGRIVNIASTAGLRGYARMTAYCASKHGVIGFTKALAQELAKSNVTVNAVCPGYTETDMAQQAIDALVHAKKAASAEEARAMIAKVNPRRTLVTVAEVASAIGWLCSPGASGVTGAVVPVANGEV